MTTLQERYITALKLRGSQIVPYRSDKYVTMTRPNKPGTFYFIGCAGAVRYGRNVTQSFAASDEWKAKLLNSALAEQYIYTIKAQAAVHQSDAGKCRIWQCQAYNDEQALAWAKKWFANNATVEGIIDKRPVPKE